MCCCRKDCNCGCQKGCKCFPTLVVIIAIIVGVFSCCSTGGAKFVFAITKFASIMIPVLAAGALIKYLFHCGSCCCCCKDCCSKKGDKACECGTKEACDTSVNK